MHVFTYVSLTLSILQSQFFEEGFKKLPPTKKKIKINTM